MTMFRLSKADLGKIAAAAKRLEQPASALLAALANYNHALSELRELVTSVSAAGAQFARVAATGVRGYLASGFSVTQTGA